MDQRAIVFSTDFSQSSQAAGKHALDIAKAFKAPLIIVHVLDSWAGFPAYEDQCARGREEGSQRDGR